MNRDKRGKTGHANLKSCLKWTDVDINEDDIKAVTPNKRSSHQG